MIDADLKKEIETQLAIFPYTKVSPELPESRFLVIQKELFLFAQHFAKWGADHTPLPEDTVLFNKGVAEGKRLMMEEALEGEITTDNRGNNVLRAGVLNNGFEIGDKVKIIVINE